jgi:excisionase family DNA binding protein
MERKECAEVVEDGLVTVRDSAAFLKISVASVYALMARGELPYVKIGRARRVPRRALFDLATKNLVRRDP